MSVGRSPAGFSYSGATFCESIQFAVEGRQAGKQELGSRERELLTGKLKEWNGRICPFKSIESRETLFKDEEFNLTSQ